MDLVTQASLVAQTVHKLHKLPSRLTVCSAGDPGLIPGSGRYPGEGNGNPLQYSCLENPMDGEAWWTTVYGIAKNRTRLSDFTYLPSCGASPLPLDVGYLLTAPQILVGFL